MSSFFRLIRYPNLLIIIVTMLSIRYGIVYPFLKLYGFDFVLSNLDFALLVLSTVFIAAGGYAINDYFDVRIDMENKPKEVLVGNKITRRMTMAIHNILSILGVLLGVFVSYRVGKLSFSFIFVLISGALWFYSTIYKRRLLVGNFLIALLTGIVPLMILLFDVPLIIEKYRIILIAKPAIYSDIKYMMYAIILFSSFAFLTTLAREIIKDAQDYQGDTLCQRKTVANTWGFSASKWMASALLLVTIAALWFIYSIFLKDDIISLVYLILALTLPLLGLVALIFRAKSDKDYKFASNVLKVIMLVGLMYLIPFYMYITHAL